MIKKVVISILLVLVIIFIIVIGFRIAGSKKEEIRNTPVTYQEQQEYSEEKQEDVNKIIRRTRIR